MVVDSVVKKVWTFVSILLLCHPFFYDAISCSELGWLAACQLFTPH